MLLHVCQTCALCSGKSWGGSFWSKHLQSGGRDFVASNCSKSGAFPELQETLSLLFWFQQFRSARLVYNLTQNVSKTAPEQFTHAQLESPTDPTGDIAWG